MKKALIVLLLVVAITGCKKYTRAPEEADQTKQPGMEETMETTAETGIKEEMVEDMVVAREDDISETAMSAEEREKALIEEAKTVFRDIHFDYDKYNIRAEDRPILDSVAEFLNKNDDLNIVIEGHCDERGTNEYNLALGERRAKATRKYLATLGVSESRIIVVTYGEEKPLCTEQTESCWQDNRRAHFAFVK